MAFQTYNAILDKFKLDRKRINQVDSTFQRNLVKRKVQEVADKYLEPGKSLVFEVRMTELDSMLDIIYSKDLDKTLEFHQIQQNIFEMRHKNMDIF